MVFNTNQAFKLLGFVWGDYDDQVGAFVKLGFLRAPFLYVWIVFNWIQLVCIFNE